MFHTIFSPQIFSFPSLSLSTLIHNPKTIILLASKKDISSLGLNIQSSSAFIIHSLFAVQIYFSNSHLTSEKQSFQYILDSENLAFISIFISSSLVIFYSGLNVQSEYQVSICFSLM